MADPGPLDGQELQNFLRHGREADEAVVVLADFDGLSNKIWVGEAVLEKALDFFVVGQEFLAESGKVGQQDLAEDLLEFGLV